MARFEAVLEVDLRRFSLRAEVPEGWGDPDPERAPGFSLLAVSRSAVVVFTGVVIGPVRVVVETLGEDPGPYRHEGGWEDVEEVGFVPCSATVGLWQAWDLVRGAPGTLAEHGRRAYRVRVCCRGRDVDWDGVAEEPREVYLVQIWPTHPDLTAPTVWCHTSRRAHGY